LLGHASIESTAIYVHLTHARQGQLPSPLDLLGTEHAKRFGLRVHHGEMFNFFAQPRVIPVANVLPDVTRPCIRCGQPVTMSLMFPDATTNCSRCGSSSTIPDSLTHEQHGALIDEAYRKDAEALHPVRAHGVDCHACGANNPAPPAATGQSICHHCGAVLLLYRYARMLCESTSTIRCRAP